MRPAEQRIVEYASYSGWVDRVELARALDLPAPTVTTAVRKLLAGGELVAGETTGSGRAGRPRQRLRVAGPAPMTGLVSWSHDRLRLRLLDPSGDLVRELGRDQPVPDTGAHGLSPAVADLVAAAGQVPDRRLAAVVVSVPAPFLRGTGTPIEHASAEDDPRRFPVRSSAGAERQLSEAHGVPVLLENDANLGAIGELVHGAGAGADFVYVTIGRHGFGSGVVVNGRLVRGARGYTGELAHLQMDHDGPLCTCGGRGCLWMQLRRLSAIDEGAPSATPLDFAELPARAEAGDAGAARLLRDVGRTIGRPLAQLCTMLDPHRLVLDGALGPSVDHVVRGIREAFSVDAPPAVADNIDVVVSPLPAADVLGACELPREHARHA
jgi:predicted NBD/HSP70 family sugar kinase